MGRPTASVAAGAASYNDVTSAARAALKGIKGHEGQEHAGVILKDPNGKFYATDPILSSAHDQFDLSVPLQKGWSIAGIYHTHPGNDQFGQYFSPNDINVA